MGPAPDFARFRLFRPEGAILALTQSPPRRRLARRDRAAPDRVSIAAFVAFPTDPFSSRARAPILSSVTTTRPTWIVCVLALALGACGGSNGPDDASTTPDAASNAPDAAEPQCTPDAFTVPSGDGAADPLSVAAGEVRAGRLSADAVPTDSTGLGQWREGDFVLANERVGVIVSSDQGPGQLYDPYGGRVVGLARVEGGALVKPADYNMILLGLGRFILATESVGVVADGSDGQPAVIRAVGTLTRIRALADLLDGFLPGDFEGMPAALDYELAPDSDALDIYLSVRADQRGIRAGKGAVVAFFQSFRMPAWAPENGFGDRLLPTEYVAFEGDDTTSYAWKAADGEMVNPLFGTGGIDVITGSRYILERCGEGRLHLGRMVVGGDGLPGVQAAIAGIDGTSLQTLSGSVVEADGSPAQDVRLHVTTADGTHLTRFRPAADGTFSVQVDPNAAQIYAWREGEGLVGPVDIGSGDVQVEMGARGTIAVTATDDADTPMPVRVEVFPLDGSPPTAPDPFGEHPPSHGRSLVAFPTDGVVSLDVPVGHYRVSVTRGPEYERIDPEVQVNAGEEVPVTAALARVVDTTDVMCADFHIHTHRSVDSADTGTFKVRALVADGLEIPIRSDHEWVNDFQPVVESLGLADFAFGIAGLELTTFTYGHFGVFPLVPDDSRPSGGAVLWYDRLAPAVFDEVRGRPESPGLIINHPRAGGIRQGYFIQAGYDPDTGAVTHPELWDDRFSVVEVFNSSDFEHNRDTTVKDWLSLLVSGRRVYAVGSSDSHRIYDAPVGFPRTCLRIGVDDPRALTGDMVRDTAMAGHAVVSGGIYLDVTGPDGARPGDEVSGAGMRASLDVVVRAAPWVDVTRLEVIVDGVTTETMPITAADADPLDPTIRAHATIEADVQAGGSFVILHAAGDQPVDSVGDLPYAVSNPIFLSR